MRHTRKMLLASGALVSTLLGLVGASWAGPFGTPDPRQAVFYEQLRSGARPAGRTHLTAAQRRALQAPPKLATVAAAVKPEATTFYITAHPDDFLGFMYPHRDVVQPTVNAVFVILTAGDAGLAASPTNAPYYLARENGATRAIRFMADASSTAVATPTSGRISIAGHNVFRTVYKNTTTYYLRLPDGNGDGNGFPGDGNASLLKLKNGQIRTLKAVDGSTTYNGWTDLVKTLTAIVKTQAAGTPNVWLNAHETDTTANPGDHSDHIVTGLATAAIQPALPCVNYAYHVGYATSGLINLDLGEITDKAGAFGNYASGMAEKGYPGAAWDGAHKSFLGGMVLRLAYGNGQGCAF